LKTILRSFFRSSSPPPTPLSPFPFPPPSLTAGAAPARRAWAMVLAMISTCGRARRGRRSPKSSPRCNLMGSVCDDGGGEGGRGRTARARRLHPTRRAPASRACARKRRTEPTDLATPPRVPPPPCPTARRSPKRTAGVRRPSMPSRPVFHSCTAASTGPISRLLRAWRGPVLAALTAATATRAALAA
jgi:hypothetical protein